MTELFLKLLCSESAIDALTVRVEDRVSTGGATVCSGPSVCIRIQHIQQRYHKVDRAKAQFNEESPQYDPQDSLEEGWVHQDVRTAAWQAFSAVLPGWAAWCAVCQVMLGAVLSVVCQGRRVMLGLER